MSERHTFRAWPVGYHEFDGLQHEYNEHTDGYKGGALQVASKYAEHFHSQHDGWECTWPMSFLVRDLGPGQTRSTHDENGPVYTIEVERETVPVFAALGRELPAPTPPGPHDRKLPNGDDVCLCAHTFGLAGPCTKKPPFHQADSACVCETGQRFYRAEDNGAIYWFVAADAAAAREIMVAAEVELEDDDGNAFKVNEHPERLDALGITFDEMDQQQARGVKIKTGDDRGEIRLLHARVGEWFCTDY